MIESRSSFTSCAGIGVGRTERLRDELETVHETDQLSDQHSRGTLYESGRVTR